MKSTKRGTRKRTTIDVMRVAIRVHIALDGGEMIDRVLLELDEEERWRDEVRHDDR